MFLTLEQRLRETVARHIAERYQLDVPVVVELPRQSGLRRAGAAGLFHARQATQESPAQDRRRDGRGAEADSRHRRARSCRRRLHQRALRPRRLCGRAARRAGSASARRRPKRSSSSTPTSIPTRPPTSATCATRCWATRWCACCASWATTSRRKTTSTTRACRWPTSSPGFTSSKRNRPPRCGSSSTTPRCASTTIAGTSTRKLRSTTPPSPPRSPWRARDAARRSKPARATLAEMGRIVADAIVNYHLDTMLRIGVEYDVLPRESEILHLQFWSAAFELLKQRQAIYLETEGKNKGCWVMPAHLFQQKRRTTPRREGGERKRRRRQNRRRRFEGHRALRWHGHLRRQGHRLPALEVRAARARISHYAPLRDYADGRTLVGVDARRRASARPPKFGGGSTACST